MKFNIAKQEHPVFHKFLPRLGIAAAIMCFLIQPLTGQVTEPPPNDPLESLRSDVGIVGLTANLDWWNHFTYMDNDTLEFDSNHEVEIVFRDVRMLSPRVGVGFQVLGSFFIDGSDFGIGGWGLGPVVRGYPFKTDRFLPYLQAKALLGNNMGLGKLSDTVNKANGFRMRLGLRAGLAVRISNSLGLFVEFGPDWESSTLFKADSRLWQVNIGFDVYRFKR